MFLDSSPTQKSGTGGGQIHTALVTLVFFFVFGFGSIKKKRLFFSSSFERGRNREGICILTGFEKEEKN